MTTFLLIRHASTNALGKHLSGRAAGVCLNPSGKQQALQLGQRLKHLTIHAIYSSPLERAIETAEPIAKAQHLTTSISNSFLELDFGEWTNNAFEELSKQVAFKNFNAFRSNTPIPGGELMIEAQVRFVSGMQQLKRDHANQTVAIVSHSDLIKAAVAFYAGIHLDMFQRLEISPASVSIIQLFEETARIICINHTGELSF